MPGFDYGSREPFQDDPKQLSTRNARYGRVLFICYALLYAGFMVLNAFYPNLMQVVLLGGINLAVLYGLLLIATAFLLALFYDWLCSSSVAPPEQNEVRS